MAGDKTDKVPETTTQVEVDPNEVEIPLIGVRLPRDVVPWLIAGLVTMLFMGWFFLSKLPNVWFDEEGYYSHGLLIPFMTMAAIYMRRDKIRAEPVSTSKAGLVILVFGLLGLVAARVIENLSLGNFAFMVTLIGACYFAFGAKVSKHLVGPLLFLIFMMPVLGWLIDIWTNPLQIASTHIAEKLLNIVAYNTDMSPAQPTVIHMNNYTLNVGGPCSGFKLILSLTAFTAFFVMISKLGWKKNLALFALTLPLALFINGLRIMLIGVVGEGQTSFAPVISPFANWLRNYGDDAGMVFHDFSGYGTLLICFVILHFIVRALEGKEKKKNAEAA
jgi:exosortase